MVFDLLAGCSVDHRYFAGIANFVDVSFHAGLKAAFAGLDIRAKLFGVSRTGLGIYHLEQFRLAVVGQVLDVRLEAVLDLAPPACTPGHCALASFRQAPVTSTDDAMEDGSNSMAARKRELVMATRVVM